ncbi:MAG: hypothetical protein KJP04_11475, partial [Arenicella sp.]|nr:hypothetical protein [Arenicella sp.]
MNDNGNCSRMGLPALPPWFGARMSDYAEHIKSTASQLSQLIPKTIDAVVILGTGMSKISDALSLGQSSVAEFNVDSIACLKPLGAPGHAGIIRIIEFENKTIAICSGRAHLYEGYTAREVCAQIYLLYQLGASRLLITNASGALNPNFRPGD